MTTGSIRIAMTSDVGLRRKNNQDTGFAQQGVFMVCDGMPMLPPRISFPCGTPLR